MTKLPDNVLLAIYKDGRMDRRDLSSGDLRNIGQQLIAMADNVMIPGNIPAEIVETVAEEND